LVVLAPTRRFFVTSTKRPAFGEYLGACGMQRSRCGSERLSAREMDKKPYVPSMKVGLELNVHSFVHMRCHRLMLVAFE
jgi:hypothetical protein